LLELDEVERHDLHSGLARSSDYGLGGSWREPADAHYQSGYILPNKLLWYIAFANVFVYLLRYGILDWAPTYLKESDLQNPFQLCAPSERHGLQHVVMMG